MSVELVTVPVVVPKEMNEVRVAIAAVVEDLKAKKDLGTVGMENLKNLSDAIAGLEKIPAEAREKLKESCVCAGLLGGELTGILLSPSEAPAIQL